MANVNFDQLEREVCAAIQGASTEAELEEIRVRYLGKKGNITGLLKQIGSVALDERRVFGEKVNQLKNTVETFLAEKKSQVSPSTLKDFHFDPTLPGIAPNVGSLHPITQTIREISNIFVGLGFEVVDGREIETEFYNFTALNIPKEHPSRDAFDTFYTAKGALLRSQTSTVQVREMEKRKPPLRIIAPGRVYRPDAVDASHSFMFHQIEGLMVDGHTTFSDLKGVLHIFLRKLFGKDLQMRFRPHFFPFTEPSVEIDIRWGNRWLEVLGAGQVNPSVFKQAGYNPKNVQGFAFGVGVERIAMLRHGINDIRLFFENHVKFLEQFQ
ncbi:MAG: phenylalanine--tRNA ligase subunit alpha [Candidatus Omnitrophica bacterium]|nr:phenylalanine--tRNA ligase subunit alpha [Candidatus Omnitrophota bacterium]